MLRLATCLALAVAVIATSPVATSAKSNGKARSGPPNANAMALDVRSPVAVKRGANKRDFCPPGQARKSGRGSAFNC